VSLPEPTSARPHAGWYRDAAHLRSGTSFNSTKASVVVWEPWTAPRELPDWLEGVIEDSGGTTERGTGSGG